MLNFNQFLEKELNNPQKNAATFDSGPLIVIAGAGSGKTRVITSRIAHLILNKNILPNSIVALTFTNKAANEMKERLNNFLNNFGNNNNFNTYSKSPYIGTFHSYCLLLLRTNSHLLNFKDFSILDGDDQKSLIKKILKKFGLEKQFSVNEMVYEISNFKNKINHDEFELLTPIVKEIFHEYETEKAKAHNFDFDDLLLEILKMFKSNIDFRNNFQKKIRHLLIDEYQDTNGVQHELLRYMALDNNNKFNIDSICAVGDEDQSIYSWRGAMATNMQKFQHDFKPVELIKIEQNYRTVIPILNAANNLILNNKNRTNKNLWSDKKANNRILSISCRSGKQEAYAVTDIINNLCNNNNNNKLNEIAILYRTHYQSRNIEEALIANSIPYKIIGGIRFYERKEIKDLLAYLRLIINPYDKISLMRVINCPNRGLSDKFEEILDTEWNLNPLLDFKQILNFIINNNNIKITGTKKQAILDFLKLYKNIENINSIHDIIENIINNINYFDYLEKEYDNIESNTKKENIKELINSIYNFEKDNVQNSLKDFLYSVSLIQEKIDNEKENNNQVQCMTLHAAKGLEFDTIIIIGLEEGLLPSSKSFNSLKELEEERRLLYVGITRAKERLILLHAISRNSYGQISDQVISRFLTEIPENLIKVLDINEKTSVQINFELANWLGNKSNTVLTFQDFASDLASNMTFKSTSESEKLFNTKKQKIIKSKTNKKSITIFHKQESTLTPSPWAKNQLVSHPKFGVGLIKQTEKHDSEYYLIIAFKAGEKKILSSFVTKI
ncbi:MAG: hypothetical protein SZ59_C0005G0067 [candidate division TM6 bacterium GW2011_GWF2_28_16]|nr:MAG: hypothetical protein SZ59_C0005G0067 [candidate division TM6 bacterium GW2011_GWF2_28_16]